MIEEESIRKISWKELQRNHVKIAILLIPVRELAESVTACKSRGKDERSTSRILKEQCIGNKMGRKPDIFT